MFHYDGQGCCSCFLSKLIHRSGYAENGTYKIALFCEKTTRSKLKQSPSTGLYPKELIFDNESINKKIMK